MIRTTWTSLAAAVMIAAPLGYAAHAADPTITAKLIEPAKKAIARTATVEVAVENVSLIDPATVEEKPATGQAHLHYQVDDGMVIATTAPKLSFHDLTPGTHRIKVMLAANDHTLVGPAQTLTIVIP